MRVMGMISGTSHDGIDVAIVEFAPDGEGLRGRIVHTASAPYDPELRRRLVAALPPTPTTLAEVCELDTLIGQAFAAAATDAIAAAGPVELVVSHGQTVYHWVEGGRARGTLQIGQPAWIAERAGATVLSDVRIRDITAGGHGAPLVSYMDRLLLEGFDGVPAALNLGGIANITLPRGAAARPGRLVAYDIGPANALIDAAVADGGAGSFDVDGRLAASGSVDAGLLDELLDEPYYRLPPPKSTGKELFNLAYVRDRVPRHGPTPRLADLVATLTELTVRTVADDVRAAGVTTLLLSGGGARNPVIVEGLRAALPSTEVLSSDAVGAPSDDKEAIAFALIGWCTAHGLPATDPAGTGADGARILGTLTPGTGPLRLPAPREAAPRFLKLEAAG